LEYKRWASDLPYFQVMTEGASLRQKLHNHRPSTRVQTTKHLICYWLHNSSPPHWLQIWIYALKATFILVSHCYTSKLHIWTINDNHIILVSHTTYSYQFSASELTWKIVSSSTIQYYSKGPFLGCKREWTRINVF